MINLDSIWSDLMWRECFRLARSVPVRPVVGCTLDAATFDPFDIDLVIAATAGEQFGAPYVGAFRVELHGERPSHAFVLVSGRCETTIGNGCDRWDEDSVVDVQIAVEFDDLVRLAMTTEERARLGYTA